MAMLYPETARFAGKRNRFFDDISGRQYETYRIGRLVRWHKGWKRNVDDGKRNLVEDTLFFFGTLQKCRGHQPGRIDCGSPCRLFHDGFIRTARSTWHEGRRNPDYGDTGNGQNGKGFSITHIHLDVHARIPGGDADIFRTEAFHAKENCPVSRVLNTDISVVTTLDMI